VHLNSVQLIGRVSPKGPQFRTESGTPRCTFVLEVDDVLPNGKIYTTFIPVEISGKFAEATASEIAAGDVLQISGKWKYKSVVDPKSGAKVSKPVVSTWGVQQREAHDRAERLAAPRHS
jgi:primosomal replication protein N